MPVYDLKCKKCGHTSEKILKISDDNPFCKKCGGKTERMVGTPCFKGSGEGWCGSKSQMKHKGIKKKD